jgi:hypothetical protein
MARSGTDAAAANRPLAGTAWRLVETQSMDDASGIKRPDDRNKYALQLRPDGTVTMPPFVRGCLLKNGRLHLSLMADGGMLGWKPADIQRVIGIA